MSSARFEEAVVAERAPAVGLPRCESSPLRRTRPRFRAAGSRGVGAHRQARNLGTVPRVAPRTFDPAQPDSRVHVRRRRIRIALAAALALFGALAPASADLARGDEEYARRAEGHVAERAKPERIEGAVRAYENALAREPENLEAYWKLLRALHFQGDFATSDAAAAKRLFERATALAEEAQAKLAARAGSGLAEVTDDELRARLSRAGIPVVDAAALNFWSAVAWGSWSQRHGLLEAVRAGVAGRIFEGAALASRLDPALEQGGALRLLSRLHATLPRVPFISGFVDRRRAEPLAAETVGRWPDHPGNRFLLALTWLEVETRRREDAIALLEEVAATEPRATQLVEDTAVVIAAKQRLALELRTDG